MISKYFSFLCCCFTAIFLSCNTATKNTKTYFGGKIINPKSNYVVLFKSGEVIDTILLDKNNRFLKEFDNLKEGYYYFNHGIENQYLYLEENDSLMLRLNTWDFDESLVFAGKGAERNNILIDCFLEDEKDNDFFSEIVLLEPKPFKHKIDSLLLEKKEAYNNYVLNHPSETDSFKKMLNVALTYPIFSRIERYPVIHVRRTSDTVFHNIENFFTHRQEIEINNNDLMYYPPYTKYVRNYLYNETYALGHSLKSTEYSSNFTSDLLHIINKKIKSETSKNAFLKQTVLWHFYRKSSCDANQKPFEIFFNLSTNKEDISQLERLLSDTKKLNRNKKLPSFHVNDMMGNKQYSNNLIHKKKSFIFFWNPKYVSEEYIASRINYLQKNYPKVNFLTVKIDGNKNDIIPNLNIRNQYFIDTSNDFNQFLTSKMPRSIIVNEKGIISNGYASISSRKLNKQLHEFCKY